MLISGLIYLETTKKKPINWFPSYAAKHKIPYGTFVLREEMSNLFPSEEIKNIKIPPIKLLNRMATGIATMLLKKFPAMTPFGKPRKALCEER